MNISQMKDMELLLGDSGNREPERQRDEQNPVCGTARNM
jgi:hypothetical protein